MAKERLVFIDWMRGLAMLVMIEVHVVNTLMLPALRDTWWFPLLNFVNGLVAPSFIFISGFAFALASRKKLEDFRRYGWEFWRQLGRIGLLFLCGYVLHLPDFSFRHLSTAVNVSWRGFFSCDVLQCIGFSLLVVFLARLWIRSDRVYQWFLAVVGVVILAVGPFMWQFPWENHLPPYIAPYLTNRPVSLFPIFPWMAFLVWGAFCGNRFIRAREEGREDAFMNRTAMLGLLFAAVGILYMTPLNIQGRFMPDKPGLLFFTLRLGCVCLLLWFSRWYTRLRGLQSSFMSDAGRESLLVYFLHLQVIYRSVFAGRNIIAIVGRRLDLGQALLASVLLCVLMVICAKVWGMIKRRNMTAARWVMAGVWLAMIVVFFVAP